MVWIKSLILSLCPAAPSAPSLYLQTTSDLETGRWALLCVTGGFHPTELSLTWTYQSAAPAIDHLSVNSCTLPVPLNPQSDPSENQTLRCVQMVDINTSEVYLVSVLLLPDQQSLEAGITFSCVVEGHPAMTVPLTASYTWGNTQTRNYTKQEKLILMPCPNTVTTPCSLLRRV